MSKLTIRNPESLFFTADTHFGHKNVMKYCNRPFSSVEEMNDSIINTWNSVVGELDTVVHLGDFSFLKPDESRKVMEQLNGHIILVRGNHDYDKIIDACGFSDVVDFLELKVYEEVDGGIHQPISCMHYPMAVWPSSHYGAWHIHGHSHGTYKQGIGKRLDVGWDVWQKPISYSTVKDYMAHRMISTIDHHDEDTK
jgi:calcineurin-like phosphoesterase family protein